MQPLLTAARAGRAQGVSISGCDLYRGALRPSGGPGWRVARGGRPRIRCHTGSGCCDEWRRICGLPRDGTRRVPGSRSHPPTSAQPPSRRARDPASGRSAPMRLQNTNGRAAGVTRPQRRGQGRNFLTSALNARGTSRCGRWPAFGSTTRRDPAIPAWIAPI
jgi:hypothetical protein